MNDIVTLSNAGKHEETRQTAVERIFGVDRILELIAVFTIITSLIGLAAALAGVFYAPQVLLGSLLLTGGYAYLTKEWRALPGLQPKWRHLAMLLAIALFFRVPVYHYTLGAQDEGLYTNMAHHIDRTGGITARDKVRDDLKGTPYLQTYLQDNRIYEGNSPTLYLSGVYARERGTSHLVFQFYYLFPVWMALVGGIFGATFAVYALSLFALLSIIFAYRLALLLTRSHKAALVAGALLALNPLHAFFSKFPVTEMPTLAFSLIGFTLLAGFWTANPSDRRRHWLWLSVSAFLCLFTTRISGFMYVPFFIALAAASLAWDRDLERRHDIQRWAVGGVAVYFVSVAYGLHWSRYYSRDTYLTSFKPLLGHHWRWVVELLVLAGLAIWAGMAWWARSPECRARMAAAVRPIGTVIGCAVCAALALGSLKIYWLGWTNHYAGSGLDTRWGFSHGGWNAASASSLSTLIVYLGPLLVLAFFALIFRRQKEPCLEFLRLFVAGFLVFALLLQWVIPYAAYYARYLLSELVPYLILYVVCVWSALRPSRVRTAISAALFFSLVYAGVLSAAQIGKSEDAGAYEALSRLVAPVEANDLILLDTLHRQPDTSIIKTPLVYTFGRNVVTVGDDTLSNDGYLAELNSIYDDLFLISSSPIAPRGFTRLDGVRFLVMTYQHTHFFPRKLVPAQDVVLNLYRLDRPLFPLDKTQYFRARRPWMDWLSQGWSDPEPWGVWSSGKHAQLDIDSRELPDDGNVTLTLNARTFVTTKHPLQRIYISVNGSLVAHYDATYPATDLAMSVPISHELLKSQQRIRIGFDLPDAISPQAIGVGHDERELAIGLISMEASLGSAQQKSLPSKDISLRGTAPKE